MPDYSDATNVKPVQSIANLVNSSDGTASATKTILGPCVRGVIAFPLTLTTITDADLVTAFPIGEVLGQSGKITRFFAVTTTVCSTAGDDSTLNIEIGSTNLTGGVLELDSDNLTTKGAVTEATAITAANTFTATDTISIEATSTTSFAEGVVTLYVAYELDNADNNFATIAAQTA
jgi:hypothetical protein